MMEIKKNGVLRYLGYTAQNLDLEMATLIDRCIEEIYLLAQPRSTFKFVDIEVDETVTLIDYGLQIRGRSIAEHLQNAEQCAIFAATLGSQVDKQIQQYQVVDMTRAVILDACATEAIESVCDEVDEVIGRDICAKGLSPTTRFSPGYGDCSLEIQPRLLQILEASKKIGLISTKECLLLPKKSVTAFIGLISGEQDVNHDRCGACTSKAICRYRGGTK